MGKLAVRAEVQQVYVRCPTAVTPPLPVSQHLFILNLMSRPASSQHKAARSGDAPSRGVVPLNDAAALYLALAEAIQGTAIGLSPEAQRLLRDGLWERFEPILAVGGRDAVDELLKLATDPRVA